MREGRLAVIRGREKHHSEIVFIFCICKNCKMQF
uniref:Uncharacterized protein n=1 Tax=Anguilla anguilla TaxID=7936 RepID=A0A0E9PU34_ANGAN